jgi:hypothetical protein
MQRVEIEQTGTATEADKSLGHADKRKGIPMQNQNTHTAVGLNPSLRDEALRVLDTLKSDQVNLALKVLCRMTVSPWDRLARLMGWELPVVAAHKAALDSGKNPLQRTQQLHCVLLDLLDGVGAEDMFLLVQLVARMRKTAGIAPDSLAGDVEGLFDAGDTEDDDANEDLMEASVETAVESPTPDPADDEPIPDTVRQFSTLSSRVELDTTLDGLDGDEIAVLASIAKRIEMGRKVYGPLQIATDPRAFRSNEARQELEDTLVYLTVAWLKATAQEVA